MVPRFHQESEDFFLHREVIVEDHSHAWERQPEEQVQDDVLHLPHLIHTVPLKWISSFILNFKYKKMVSPIMNMTCNLTKLESPGAGGAGSL